MSTRRARIKAIASLPIRRRNNDFKPYSTEASVKRHTVQIPKSSNEHALPYTATNLASQHPTDIDKSKVNTFKHKMKAHTETQQSMHGPPGSIIHTKVDSVTAKHNANSLIQHNVNSKTTESNDTITSNGVKQVGEEECEKGSVTDPVDQHKRGFCEAGPSSNSVAGRIGYDSHPLVYSHPSHRQVRDRGRYRNESVRSDIHHPEPQPQRREAIRINALRQKLRARGEITNKDQLTMLDLIFYNPTTHPMMNKDMKKSRKNDEEKESEEEDGPEYNALTVSEEEAGGPAAFSGMTDKPSEGSEKSVHAPQIKLGPNGEVLIDEQSLVIPQKKNRRLSESVVQEFEWNRGGNGPGGRYNRAPRTKKWPDDETVRFYRALAAVGTDFSLMVSLFPDRTRKDIKFKFKKEERCNKAQVDKALMTQTVFDLESLTEQFNRERLEAEELSRRYEKEAREKKRAERERKKPKCYRGKAAKSVIETVSSKQQFPEEKETTQTIASSEPNQKLAQKTVTGKLATAPLRKLSPVPETQPSQQLKLMSSVTHSYNLPLNVDPLSVTKDVAPSSLVCLTIPDDKNPSKNVLQTYMTDGAGKMKPISLPKDLLNSVMDYMSSTSSQKECPQAQSALAALPNTAQKALKGVHEDSVVRRDNTMSSEQVPSDPGIQAESISSPNLPKV